MKTAMQELLDDIEKHIKVDWPMNKSIRNSITKALEKEKEQIKTAFESGWNWNFSSEKYYNETYNPAPYQHKANEFKDNDKIEINPITGDVKIITNEKN